MSKTKILILFIILASFFIRVFQVNTYPPLLWDEASLGYNAYSILKTARDEHGQFLPIIFKSFGDYKPGLYIYLTLPFVAIFGLNPLSVRLPSIILGSLLPLFLYLLIKQLSKSNKLALISAALTAITPYTIHYSKGAWETNILTIELVLACYFFFKNKFLISSLLFASTLYTYQSGKLISLLLIIVLLIQNKHVMPNLFRHLLTKFFLPLSILALPIVYGLFFSSDSNRLKIVSLFSYPRPQSDIETITTESSRFDYQLFHNQGLFFAQNFLNRYFNHFSPEFLFTKGDWQNSRHSAPYIGVLLYPSLFFLPFGLFSKTKYKSAQKFFLLWFLLAPIPAALTRDTIQATRSLPMVIPLIFFTALGINKIYHSRLILLLASGFYLLSFLYYQDLYYFHMVKKDPDQFLWGYQQAINYINTHPHQNIYFTSQNGQPYIFYLFFSQYSPQKYQHLNSFITTGDDVGQVSAIDNVQFMTVDLHFASQKPDSLTIYHSNDLNSQSVEYLNLLKDELTPIAPINNTSTFYAYENP